MEFLMWDYGSLDHKQEAAYISAKMVMANKDFTMYVSLHSIYLSCFYSCSVQNIWLSELIVKCQQLIRQYAGEQLKIFGLEDSEAELCAGSCASQRDIQV